MSESEVDDFRFVYITDSRSLFMMLFGFCSLASQTLTVRGPQGAVQSDLSPRNVSRD